ncbi:hypothetical protein BASA61_000601 [Batrachochytrium salamandrivorans]|nr:hypothetical protein BASA61_000601 [Batrachochytrium salamandrivorans]KAH9265922.1 hypothetical protein BASA84_001382 [Batrachochytrium salamandrivorans]
MPSQTRKRNARTGSRSKKDAALASASQPNPDADTLKRVLPARSGHYHALWTYWCNHWFIICMVAVIFLSGMAPAFGRTGGPLKPELYAKKIGTLIIFWSSGLNIKPMQLIHAARNVRVHLLVAAVSLGVVPFTVHYVVSPMFVQILHMLGLTLEIDGPHVDPHSPAVGVHPDWISALCNGLLVLSCLPSPVGTSVILTKACDGNEATSIFNSTLGSIFGIALTPMLVHFYLSLGDGASSAASSLASSESVSMLETLISLGSKVILPLLAGLISRVIFERTIPGILKWPFSKLSSMVLLFIIHSTFCDAFYSPQVNPTNMDDATGASHTADMPPSVPFLGVVVLVAVLVALHMSCLFGVRELGDRLLHLPRRDTIAAMFSAGQKSLTLGIPMMNVLFPGRSDLSVMLMPLLIYHPTQILVGSVCVGSLRDWIANEQSSTLGIDQATHSQKAKQKMKKI